MGGGSSSPPSIDPIVEPISSAGLQQIAGFRQARDVFPVVRTTMKGINRMGEICNQTAEFGRACLKNVQELYTIANALKLNKGDINLINRAKELIAEIISASAMKLAAAIATTETLQQANQQMLGLQTVFANLTKALELCLRLLGEWKGYWYTIRNEMTKSSEELNGIDPSGALFRLFPNVQVDPLIASINDIINDAERSAKSIPRTIESLKSAAEEACNVHVSLGPYGGGGGDPFADPQVHYKKPLTKIQAWSGSDIDSVALFQENQSGGRHGGKGGGFGEINLQQGEHIIRVDGTHGSYMQQLHFYSSFGRDWLFGSNGGDHAFSVQVDGGVLSTITGRCGKYVDQLNFVFTSPPTLDPLRDVFMADSVVFNNVFALSKDVWIESLTNHTMNRSAAIAEPIGADINYATYLAKV